MAIVGSGFVADYLHEVTGGIYQSEPYFEVGEAATLPRTEEGFLGRIFGVDLLYANGDLETGASGDYRLTSGLEAFRAAFLRSLVTKPGEIFWWPDFGIGIVDYLNLHASAENIQEIKRRIRSSIARNELVEDIAALDVVVNADASRIDIRVAIVVAGQTRPLGFRLRSTA